MRRSWIASRIPADLHLPVQPFGVKIRNLPYCVGLPLFQSGARFMQAAPPLSILLVEDDGDDVFWFKRALHKSGTGGIVHVVENGVGAISYLCGEGDFGDREKYPFPNMIITDVKMPAMDGFELVQWIRAEPKLSYVPIIVMSSSFLEADRFKALRLGANAFFTKPMCDEDFAPVLKFMTEYWPSKLPTVAPTHPLPCHQGSAAAARSTLDHTGRR